MWNPVTYYIENWNEESYPDVWELRYMFVFAAFFPVIRFILDNLIYERVGRYYLFKNARNIAKAQHAKAAAAAAAANGEADALKAPLLKKGAEANGHAMNGSLNGSAQDVPSVESIDREALEKTLIKFKESCWKSLYYTSALCLAISVSWGEDYLGDATKYFRGPGDSIWPDQKMKLKLKTLFWFEGGFYLYSIFALVFWETRRKDFVVSMVHHLVSVALAVIAFVFRLGRPASLVVAIHDTSDIFLELAKVNRYLNIESFASIFFVLFAISWAVLRLYCYPKYILYAAGFVVARALPLEEHVYDGPPLFYGFNFILILLFVLHIYWWILIVRVLAKQIQHGKVDKDVRSEDESDDD